MLNFFFINLFPSKLHNSSLVKSVNMCGKIPRRSKRIQKNVYTKNFFRRAERTHHETMVAWLPNLSMCGCIRVTHLRTRSADFGRFRRTNICAAGHLSS